MPVTQEYLIRWEPDQDAGRAQGGGGRGGFGGGRGPGGPGGLTQLFENDIDGDGRLVKNELPERMQERFDRMDANADGYFDESDLQAMRGRGGPGGRRPGGGGPGGMARLFEADADGDGKISREEAPRQLQQRFDQMDANGGITGLHRDTTDSSNDARWLAEGREVAAGPAEPRSLDRGLEARTPVHASGSGQRAL